VFQSTICFSQKEGNTWCFGDSALIDWNDLENPIFGKSASKNRGSASSISDAQGNLLFYVGNISGDDTPEWIYCRDSIGNYEQGYIYTKAHTIMENGSCVSGEGWYNEHTIIPMPSNDSLYYKFSVNLYNLAGLDYPVGIDYCIIDMHANAGLGRVIEKDVSLVSYETISGISPVASYIKAIRHGNGRDWWLMAKSTVYNADLEPNLFFLLVLVTPEGIELQEIPINEPVSFSNIFLIGFSKNGDKFFSISPLDDGPDIFVYDFDRCTGELSNQRSIEDTPDTNGLSPLLWDAEFSPNGRYLYVNTSYTGCDEARYLLLQYDLEDENPALTRDTLLYYLESGYEEFFVGAGSMKLAPDNKIYYSRPIASCWHYLWPYPDTLYNEINMNLSVINNPDSVFPSCNFEEFSFSLGGARTYYGLPNNPNFALGAVDNFCDTTANGLNDSQKFLNTNLNIFPNPCYNNCQIQYKPAKSIGNITISNMEGKVIFKEENISVNLLQHGYEVNTAAFAKGVYFVTLVSGNQNVTKKLVRL
jgi:Secretion system C-terminal sorting domain